MSRPRLLDAFCRAGGAGMGYHRAGFDVTGIDIEDMAGVYPHKFVQGDALDYIREHGHEYDVIHASPPCQAASALTKGTNKGRVYPQLIPPTRAALEMTGRPWVIENVAGAPIRRDLMLCGEMFGLAVIRHRFFEFDDRTRVTAPASPRSSRRHATRPVVHRPVLRRVRRGRRQGDRGAVAGGDGHRLDRRPQEPRGGDPAGLRRVHRQAPDGAPLPVETAAAAPLVTHGTSRRPPGGTDPPRFCPAPQTADVAPSALRPPRSSRVEQGGRPQTYNLTWRSRWDWTFTSTPRPTTT